MGAAVRAVIAGCGLFALASCSGGTGDAAPPTTVVTVPTTVTAPSTTVAPSTTSAPTTTLSPQQGNRTEIDEAEIRELHDRFFEMLVVTADPPNPDHPEIAATTTGIQRQRMTEWLARVRELDEHTEGSISGAVASIDLLDATHAILLTCTAANSSRYSATGQAVGTDPSEPWLTELRLLRVDDEWRVEDWFVGGEQSCDD